MTAVEVERNVAAAIGIICSAAFLFLLGGTIYVHWYYALPAAVFFAGAWKALGHADQLSDYIEGESQ